MILILYIFFVSMIYAGTEEGAMEPIFFAQKPDIHNLQATKYYVSYEHCDQKNQDAYDRWQQASQSAYGSLLWGIADYPQDPSFAHVFVPTEELTKAMSFAALAKTCMHLEQKNGKDFWKDCALVLPMRGGTLFLDNGNALHDKEEMKAYLECIHYNQEVVDYLYDNFDKINGTQCNTIKKFCVTIQSLVGRTHGQSERLGDLSGLVGRKHIIIGDDILDTARTQMRTAMYIVDYLRKENALDDVLIYTACGFLKNGRDEQETFVHEDVLITKKCSHRGLLPERMFRHIAKPVVQDMLLESVDNWDLSDTEKTAKLLKFEKENEAVIRQRAEEQYMQYIFSNTCFSAFSVERFRELGHMGNKVDNIWISLHQTTINPHKKTHMGLDSMPMLKGCTKILVPMLWEDNQVFDPGQNVSNYYEERDKDPIFCQSPIWNIHRPCLHNVKKLKEKEKLGVVLFDTGDIFSKGRAQLKKQILDEIQVSGHDGVVVDAAPFYLMTTEDSFQVAPVLKPVLETIRPLNTEYMWTLMRTS